MPKAMLRRLVDDADADMPINVLKVRSFWSKQALGSIRHFSCADDGKGICLNCLARCCINEKAMWQAITESE